MNRTFLQNGVRNETGNKVGGESSCLATWVGDTDKIESHLSVSVGLSHGCSPQPLFMSQSSSDYHSVMLTIANIIHSYCGLAYFLNVLHTFCHLIFTATL